MCLLNEQGLEKARDRTMQLTDQFKVPVDPTTVLDRELLEGVARTSLRTKVCPNTPHQPILIHSRLRQINAGPRRRC